MPSPTEPTGIELSRAYYAEIVRPLLAARFPGMPHAAGRLGAGSDVLGLDDVMSRDHDWGMRLTLFVPADRVDPVDDELERLLPAAFGGHPTRFAFTGETAIRHHVDVATLSGFLDARVGFDPREATTVEDWLSLSGQAVLEVTAGDVFVDDTGDVGVARRALQWYPDDVWRHVIASDWIRLEHELPLMSRAADVGDDLGSRLIAARLSQIAMHLAFMLERRWPPYAKWLGTLFGRLPCGPEVGASLDRAIRADDWRDRQAALADALHTLLRIQNDIGLTSLDTATIPFWDRPYLRPDPSIVDELLDAVTDPAVRALPRGRGSVEQRTDNVDVLVDPAARRELTRTAAAASPARRATG